MSFSSPRCAHCFSLSLLVYLRETMVLWEGWGGVGVGDSNTKRTWVLVVITRLDVTSHDHTTYLAGVKKQF